MPRQRDVAPPGIAFVESETRQQQAESRRHRSSLARGFNEYLGLARDRQPSIYKGLLTTGFDVTLGQVPYAGPAASVVLHRAVDKTAEAMIDPDEQLRDLASRVAGVVNRYGAKNGSNGAAVLLAEFNDFVQARVRPEVRDEAAANSMWQRFFAQEESRATAPDAHRPSLRQLDEEAQRVPDPPKTFDVSLEPSLSG